MGRELKGNEEIKDKQKKKILYAMKRYAFLVGSKLKGDKEIKDKRKKTRPYTRH